MNLEFRAVEPEDADLLFEAENDMDAWPSSDNIAPYSRHTLREYALSNAGDPFFNNQLRLMIEMNGDSRNSVGILDFYDISLLHNRAFLGIYIFSEFRNRGFASYALEKAIVYASDFLRIDKIGAKILKDNILSRHLFEKCGFNLIGILPEWHFSKGEFHDIALYLHQK